MLGFGIVCLGQVVSILASNMTGFALAIWVFQRTNSATALGIMQTAFVVPYLVFIPIAGALVDRYDRKLMMMVSDMTAALGTLTILVLYATGALQIWHFYVVNVVVGLGSAFQWPAYSAAITTMVPKEQYSRANGMLSLVQASPAVVAPLMAGALLPVIGLLGILLTDVVTFAVAIGTLLVVYVPPPVRTAEGQEGQGSLLREAVYGVRYIWKRPGLLGLVLLLFAANFFLGFPNSVTVPMVLLRTGNDSLVLGAVQTAGAISWAAGSLLMSVWGGFKRRIHGVLLGWSLYCVFGAVLMGFGRGLPVWVPALLLAGIMATVGNASSQAILQAKVAPDVQGRVFAARRMISWAPDALTPVLGGLLADLVMEPAMRTEGGLARLLGRLVGTGPGAGMSLIMVFFGVCTILTLLAGYLVPHIRNMEQILPDHDQLREAREGLPG